MSRRSKKKTKRKRSSGFTGAWRVRLASLSWAQLATLAGRALAGAAIVGVVAGVALGVGPLRKRVGALRADPIVVSFEWPAIAGATGTAGTWLNPEEQDRLRGIALSKLTPDPFDRDSLDAARTALADTGWFIEPPTVRRLPAGRIDISGLWRTPAAVVRRDGWDRLVSRDGALLPVRYRAGDGGLLPIIVGTFTSAPRRPDGSAGYGLTWPGGDVPAAIGLIELLRTSERWSEVATIDVSRYVPDGLLTIVMRDGGRIVWGSPPGADAPGEVADSIKLKRFEQLFDDPVWLRKGHAPIEIYTARVLIDESAGP